MSAVFLKICVLGVVFGTFGLLLEAIWLHLGFILGYGFEGYFPVATWLGTGTPMGAQDVVRRG